MPIDTVTQPPLTERCFTRDLELSPEAPFRHTVPFLYDFALIVTTYSSGCSFAKVFSLHRWLKWYKFILSTYCEPYSSLRVA